MLSYSLKHARHYRFLTLFLVFALICSSIPLSGWDFLFGVGIAHAASDSISQPPSLSSPERILTPQILQSTLVNRSTNIATLEANAQHKPATLVNPISISRMQSSDLAAGVVSGTLTITFTVTNNQIPSVVPQLPVSATITDTLAAVSVFNLANDPNTLRDVLVADNLTASAIFVSASPMPDRFLSTAHNDFAFNLNETEKIMHL